MKTQHRSLLSQGGGGGGGVPTLPELTTIPTLRSDPGRVLGLASTTTTFACDVNETAISTGDGILTISAIYGTLANVGTGQSISTDLTDGPGGGSLSTMDIITDGSKVGLSNNGTSWRYHHAVEWGLAPANDPDRIVTHDLADSGVSPIWAYDDGTFTAPPILIAAGQFNIDSGWTVDATGKFTFPTVDVPLGYHFIFCAHKFGDGGGVPVWTNATSVQHAGSTAGSDAQFFAGDVFGDTEKLAQAVSFQSNATAYNEIVGVTGWSYGVIVAVGGT